MPLGPRKEAPNIPQVRSLLKYRLLLSYAEKQPQILRPLLLRFTQGSGLRMTSV